MPLKVFLADDHQVVRQGCRTLLEQEGFEVIGEAGDGHEAVRLTQALNPDVVVLDLSMPGLNGLDAAREILHARPQTAIVLLTMHTETHVIVSALRGGIRGYVLKTQAVEELVQAIREVGGGGFYMSPRVSQIVGTHFAGSEVAAEPLTPKERQVLQLIAESKTTQEIADLVGLSVRTAETYRAQIKEKLGIADTAGLVRYAVRQGLIQAVSAWCAICII